MYICLIELLNNINDMKIRKGKKDDLPVILELIKELATGLGISQIMV